MANGTGVNELPIPSRMSALDRDVRGYPIPWGVMVDNDGLPHFAINLEERRHEMVKRDLCSICGGKLFRGRWFVGGALSAFHEHGAFIDPPMHSECAHYAIQICPYLAAPRYAKEIGLAKIKGRKHPNMLLIDNTMIPGRPTGDIFVLLMATGQVAFDNLNTKPKLPYSSIEFWRHGLRIPDAEGYASVEQALAEFQEPV